MLDVFLKVPPLTVDSEFACMRKGCDNPVFFRFVIHDRCIPFNCAPFLAVYLALLTKLRLGLHLEDLRRVLSYLPVLAMVVEVVIFFGVAQKCTCLNRKW